MLATSAVTENMVLKEKDKVPANTHYIANASTTTYSQIGRSSGYTDRPIPPFIGWSSVASEPVSACTASFSAKLLPYQEPSKGRVSSGRAKTHSNVENGPQVVGWPATGPARAIPSMDPDPEASPRSRPPLRTLARSPGARACLLHSCLRVSSLRGSCPRLCVQQM